MEKTKLCISVEWKATDTLNNITIFKNLVDSFGTTQIDYFTLNLYESGMINTKLCDELDDHCREKGISWFPLVDSIRSINLTRQYYSKLPNGKTGYMLGVPSSCIKDFEILNHAKECSDYLVLYTDSCTQKEIDLAIEACQPDMVIHHSHGDARIDYLKYLQGISIEFDKRYRVGYKNRPDESSALMVAAYMLDSDFLEHTIEINDNNYSLYLDSGAPNSYTDLVIDLEEINRSRGGYEARKLSNIEKELRRK